MPLICLKCSLRTLSLIVFPCLVLIILISAVQRSCWLEIVSALVSAEYVNIGRGSYKCDLCSRMTYYICFAILNCSSRAPLVTCILTSSLIFPIARYLFINQSKIRIVEKKKNFLKTRNAVCKF